ncbi:MAG TPA: D-sedoheptulose 7-phosphate isomerase [Deltaproteobacteria bacterium]|nr:D-sedoheptulose 7-phosphate isomerase [Deltaproteobacteria bacterium]HQB39672.1 D-sedoheptulose 7-phosphate isomerase [Deltaproteobacteria bacterium]
MTEEIASQLLASSRVCEMIAEQMTPQIDQLISRLIGAFRNGNKLLVMGNGGSAADAQHFAAEMVGRFKMERKALPAVALTTDTSILTAIGNDYGYELVFRRQVEALAVQGDVVFGISTSGNSANIKSAMELARSRGCYTVGLLGRDGGSLKGACDLALVVPSDDTPRIQEGHITIIHIVCDLVEKRLFG